MQVLITIALIIIGILFFELIIFSHEFGHFITAKLSGVRVNEFALGMGPKLFGFKKCETEYSFRLLPIGGYCAMEGEDEESDEPRAFNNAKIWKRMIIIIAGAVMNIILGFLLMFAYTVQADSYASTTVTKFEPNSYSAISGLQEGDRIVELNGYSVWNINDLQFSIATLQCQEVDGKSLYVYKEDCINSACSIYLELVSENNITDTQINELYKILVNGYENIKSADNKQASKKYLDEMSKELYSCLEITDYSLPQISEKDVRLRFQTDIKVIRDGEEIELKDVQLYTVEDKETGTPSVAIDFYVDEIEKTFGSVISQTFTQTCSMGKMVWKSLEWLIQGRFSFNDLSGPVGIATAVTQVASQGLETGFGDAVNNILYVMILITINLGIFNMLPFPALDGGRFVFLLIEGIFRKPIPGKIEKIVNAVGLGILMLFMLVVSLKDVWQLVTDSFPGL